jgi:hypothetical protein
VLAVVFALALQTAAPWLANAAAQAQGKTLVEVCSVYGFRTMVIDDAGSTAPAGTSAAHDAPCALQLLSPLAVGLSAPDMSRLGLHAPSQVAPRVRAADARGQDLLARWQARLKQGPPAA